MSITGAHVERDRLAVVLDECISGLNYEKYVLVSRFVKAWNIKVRDNEIFLR